MRFEHSTSAPLGGTDRGRTGVSDEADEARVWLFSPHAELDGSSPAEVIADDRMDEVLAIIDRLQTGAYV